MYKTLIRYAGIVAFLVLVLGVLAVFLYTGFGRYSPQAFSPAAGTGTGAAEGTVTGQMNDVSAPTKDTSIEEETSARPAPTDTGPDITATNNTSASVVDIVGAHEIAPDDKLISLIDLHVKSGDLPEAEAVCRDLLKRNPERTNVRIRLGSLLTMQGRFNEACKEVATALRKEPDNFYAHLAMGEALLKAGLPSMAIDHARKAVLEAGHIPQARKLLAQSYLTEGSAGDALEQFEELVLLTPNDVDAILGLGMAYIQLGKEDLAMNAFKKAEEVKPDSPSVHMAIGQLQLLNDAFDDAIASYRKVLAVTPTHPVALNNLALITFEHNGNLDEAMRLAARAWQIAPDSPNIADTLGWLSYHAGDMNRATLMLGYAVRKRPRDQEIRYHFAAALFKRGMRVQALEQVRTALSQGDKFKSIDKANALLDEIKRTPEDNSQ